MERSAPRPATAATIHRRLELLETIRRQTVVAMAVSLGAGILAVAGLTGLTVVAAAGVAVVLAEALAATAMAGALRSAASGAIAFATVRPDDPVVNRCGQRLRRARTRRGLAVGIERWAAEARSGGTLTDPLRSLPLGPVGRLRIAAAESELLAVAARLRREGPIGTRGVAMVEWLLSDGCSSPLFSGTGEELALELRRIRYLLDD